MSSMGRGDNVTMDTSTSAMETEASDRRVCFVLFRKFTKEVSRMHAGQSVIISYPLLPHMSLPISPPPPHYIYILAAPPSLSCPVCILSISLCFPLFLSCATVLLSYHCFFSLSLIFLFYVTTICSFLPSLFPLFSYLLLNLSSYASPSPTIGVFLPSLEKKNIHNFGIV